MTNTNQQTYRQPSPAWRKGYDEARHGKPENGAQVKPAELTEYRHGHTSGLYVNRRTGGAIKGGAQ